MKRDRFAPSRLTCAAARAKKRIKGFFGTAEPVSGLFALAKPRRIKASHRRRRKVASGQSVQRYYDPGIGLFLSVDPVAADSDPIVMFNRYRYADSNPYRYKDPDGRKIIPTGTRAEKRETRKLVNEIKRSGPEGKAFIKALEKGSDVLVSQGTSATKKDGTVTSLSETGGGITLRPNESPSGKIEVIFDKDNLVNYKATDGSTVTETPGGLVLHELGHGALLQAGDPTQERGGIPAENAVRDLTNPIREEMGIKPEANP